MPKAKPKVPRLCLVCDTTFQGTNAATRCDPCKSAGFKVPSAAQATRRGAARKTPPPEGPQFEKICTACFEDFTTHKERAARCETCITENNKAHRRQCLECKEAFGLTHPEQLNCPKCAKLLVIDQCEMTPEQEDHFLAEQSRLKVMKRLAEQDAYLTGYEKYKMKVLKKNPEACFERFREPPDNLTPYEAEAWTLGFI